MFWKEDMYSIVRHAILTKEVIYNLPHVPASSSDILSDIHPDIYSDVLIWDTHVRSSICSATHAASWVGIR